MSNTKYHEIFPRERFAREEAAKGLERAGLEDRIRTLYLHYWQTGNEEFLSDLIQNAERLAWGIAYRAMQTAEDCSMDLEDILQELALKLSRMVQEDRKKGIRQENIVHTIRALYKNRTLDILDKQRTAGRGMILKSMDAMNTGEDGKPRERFGREDEIASEDRQLTKQRQEISRKLMRCYLAVMMDYRYDPHKPIALCFARVLYQLERLFSPEEIQRAGDQAAARDGRKRTSEFEKMVDAYRGVQKPATATSLPWAWERMGEKRLAQLVFEAQDSIQTHFDPTLGWSGRYLAGLGKMSTCPGSPLWRDVVYTREFTTGQTSNWAESIHKSVFHGALDAVQADPELMEEILRLNLPFRAGTRKTGKGKQP